MFADKHSLAPLAEPEKIVLHPSATFLEEELSPKSREEWLTAAKRTEDEDIGWHVTDVPSCNVLTRGHVVLAPKLVKSRRRLHTCALSSIRRTTYSTRNNNAFMYARVAHEPHRRRRHRRVVRELPATSFASLLFSAKTSSPVAVSPVSAS